MTNNHIPIFKSELKSDFKKNQASPVKNHQRNTLKKNRKLRSDKCHDIKFPVTTTEQIRLKSQCKHSNYYYRKKYGYDKKLTQTHFNTLLLRYSLENEHRIIWDRPYQDTKKYMHTKPIEREYEMIGGPYGYSTRMATSDRRVVYCLVISALEVLEREGNYNALL